MARAGYDTPAIFRGGVAVADARFSEFRDTRHDDLGMDYYEEAQLETRAHMAHCGLLATVESPYKSTNVLTTPNVAPTDSRQAVESSQLARAS